jgi:hypothetical protein
MAVRAFDYACPKGHITEHFTSSMEEEITCPECGLLSSRQISTPFVKLEGCTGDFPGAHRKWELVRREKMKIENKRNS